MFALSAVSLANAYLTLFYLFSCVVKVRSRRVHIRSGTSWVRLSVKKLVNQWIHAPKGNLGLVIHIYDSEGRILPIGSAGSVKDKSLQVSEEGLSSFSSTAHSAPHHLCNPF